MTARLTADRVRELLDYKPETGDLIWRIDRTGGTKAGDVAGFISGSGYRQVRIDGKKYFAHRVVWLLNTGEWPQHQIDHINRRKLDNRFSNLRDVSASINGSNKSAYGETGVKGVRTKGSRFVARIADNGLNRYIGLFKTAEEAATAFKTAHVEVWGIDSEFFEEVHMPHPALVELAAEAIKRRRAQLAEATQ